MTLAELRRDTRETVQKTGGYWPEKDVLLQLAEEVGELIQACRKKTPQDVVEETGDVLFVLLCFIDSRSILGDVVAARMVKNGALKR